MRTAFLHVSSEHDIKKFPQEEEMFPLSSGVPIKPELWLVFSINNVVNENPPSKPKFCPKKTKLCTL